MKVPTDDYILTDRGGIIENRHKVHAAIVDSKGTLLYAVWSPVRVTLARSTAKPAQALAILETGAFTQYDFDDADLALMCASHNAEERHIDRASSILAKIGADVGDLRCGPHASISEAVNREWIRSGLTPTAVLNNCSGKHAGMIAGAKTLGVPIGNYHLPENLMQERVRQVVQDLCGLESDEVKWGIDGCNLPAPAFPLHYLAKMYAGLAAAADDVDNLQASSTRRTQHLSRIYTAMVQHPELVAGEGRFCTILMDKYQGTVVGKVGADGCYGVAVRASERTRMLGADGAIGIAVKIEDGNLGILYSAVAEVLQQLEIGTPDMRQELQEFHYPKLANTAGVVTGHLSHAFRIRRV